MKTLEQLKQISVLAVNEGIECGRVTELIIDPAKKQAEYVVIDNGTGCLGLMLLPIGAIGNIGTEFLTIESKKELKSLRETDEMENKLSSVQLMGLRVISGEGFTIGSITEIGMDEKSGLLQELQISNSVSVSHENLLAITASLVTIKAVTPKIEETIPKTQAFHTVAPAPSSPGNAQNNDAIKQRSHEFLLGKTATQNIMDRKGIILVKQGDVITEETIRMLEGKNELVKLMISLNKP